MWRKEYGQSENENMVLLLDINSIIIGLGSLVMITRF